ncbi:hypothetical protein [Flavobacterium geliluteum]|uniref:Uncharacterized protein n=1 Tax=Flavobacterium geliluteum TaxID=2816120 RepID=A0A940X6Q5_9FLAO|nr:hypothetical protein [Flavobacterium geliluteum]MBP4136756.1 hypothetical protein [Flavobacterium geliluteum]
MKGRNIKIIVIVFIIGILIYKKDLIIEFFETNKQHEKNNLSNQNENPIEPPTAIAYKEVAGHEEDTLTEEQSVVKGIEDVLDYLEQGENFEEKRYYIQSYLESYNYKGFNNFFSANFVNDLKKDPDLIIGIFEKHHSLFYSLITRRTYKTFDFDKVVNGLLISYNDIYSSPDYKERLEEIYKIMKFQKGPDDDAKNFYSKIEPFTSDEFLLNLEEIRLISGKQFANGDIVWFYSFWARRYNENNINQVYKIINDINNHYTEDN